MLKNVNSHIIILEVEGKMNRNNLLLIALAGAVLCAGCGNKEDSPAKKESLKTVVQQETPQKEVIRAPKVVAKKQPKKINLYKSFEDRNVPLSAVVQISALPQNIREIINKQITDSEVYYLGAVKDKVIILKEALNEEDRFTRHDFEIVSVSIPDGKIQKETKFPSKMSNEDSKTEVWQYEVLEGDMVVPSTHTSLNEDGSVKTIENWFYGDDDLKYKVTNGEGKTLSLRKTTKSKDGNWRDEHIFYTDDGQTALNVSFVYENNQIARLTYYDSTAPETSVTMVNEYDDAEKTKELLYTSDYKLKNIYTSDYNDGERSEIKVFDKSNNELETFLTE